jgi:hypothetical protein
MPLLTMNKTPNVSMASPCQEGAPRARLRVIDSGGITISAEKHRVRVMVRVEVSDDKR